MVLVSSLSRVYAVSGTHSLSSADVEVLVIAAFSHDGQFDVNNNCYGDKWLSATGVTASENELLFSDSECSNCCKQEFCTPVAKSGYYRF